MMHVFSYIKERLNRNKLHRYMVDMSTIDNHTKLGDDYYRIIVHGASKINGMHPHMHIHLANDRTFKKFDFEISLIDILCKDEIILVSQIDRTRKINIKNKEKCSWENYEHIKNDFKKWLETRRPNSKETFTNNLEAAIWRYNYESYFDNYILTYIKYNGLKVLPKYEKYLNKF